MSHPADATPEVVRWLTQCLKHAAGERLDAAQARDWRAVREAQEFARDVESALAHVAAEVW